MFAQPKMEIWPVADLIPYENNAKKHDREQVQKIMASIRQAKGLDQPIVVDRDGVIIKGHGRRLACIELGVTQVPVIVRKDLSPEEVAAARLNDNRAAIGDVDPHLLRKELEAFNISGLLEGIWDMKEIEFNVADLGTMNPDAFVTDMDEVLAEQKTNVEAVASKAAGARVPLAKAFGFKDLAATHQIVINKLMAKAEALTGLKAGDALAAWAEEALA